MRGLLPLFGEVRVGALLAAGLLLFTIGAASDIRADEPNETVDSDATFLVSRFTIRYRHPHPNQPSLDELLPLTVRLGVSPSGFVAPSLTGPVTRVEIGNRGEALPYHAGAIGTVASSLLAAIQQRGLLGVYVEPDPSDIDIQTETDLRPEGDSEMGLVVSTARVRALRTIADGDRIDSEWRIDNSAHGRVRLGSPLQPTGADSDESVDLLDTALLDEYLFRLNRHPGRLVGAALAPAEDGTGISLDYQVTESKPWYVYAQVANTGTQEAGEWQQRFGFVHNQLTDRDDILTLSYFRSGLNRSNGVSFSYEAPWFDADRPWWWNTPQEGPGWLFWWDRSKWPWFGSEKLRWRVWGHYLGYKTEIDLSAADLGKETVEGRDWDIGGRLIYNAFQHRALFLDAFIGIDGRGVLVDNQAATSRASRIFLLPHIGVDVERITPVSTLFANLTFEGNALSADVVPVEEGGNPARGIDALGRADPDDLWYVLYGDMGWTQYLEPLLNAAAWEDPSTEMSSTLAHEIALGARGQYAFGHRLVPQAEQVLGGLYSVRGYAQSAAAGDNIVIGTFEYRFHLPHSLPVEREPMQLPLLGDFRVSPQQVYGRPDWDFVIRAFIDTGYASSNKRPNPQLERSEFLLGTGVGAEFSFRNNFRARMDWGIALHSTKSLINRVDAGDDAFHLLFTVLY